MKSKLRTILIATIVACSAASLNQTTFAVFMGKSIIKTYDHKSEAINRIKTIDKEIKVLSIEKEKLEKLLNTEEKHDKIIEKINSKNTQTTNVNNKNGENFEQFLSKREENRKLLGEYFEQFMAKEKAKKPEEILQNELKITQQSEKAYRERIESIKKELEELYSEKNTLTEHLHDISNNHKSTEKDENKKTKDDKNGNSKGDEDGNSKGDEDGNSKGDEDGNSEGDEDGKSEGDEDGNSEDIKTSVPMPQAITSLPKFANNQLQIDKIGNSEGDIEEAKNFLEKDANQNKITNNNHLQTIEDLKEDLKIIIKRTIKENTEFPGMIDNLSKNLLKNILKKLKENEFIKYHFYCGGSYVKEYIISIVEQLLTQLKHELKHESMEDLMKESKNIQTKEELEKHVKKHIRHMQKFEKHVDSCLANFKQHFGYHTGEFTNLIAEYGYQIRDVLIKLLNEKSSKEVIEEQLRKLVDALYKMNLDYYLSEQNLIEIIDLPIMLAIEVVLHENRENIYNDFINDITGTYATEESKEKRIEEITAIYKSVLEKWINDNKIKDKWIEYIKNKQIALQSPDEIF